MEIPEVGKILEPKHERLIVFVGAILSIVTFFYLRKQVASQSGNGTAVDTTSAPLSPQLFPVSQSQNITQAATKAIVSAPAQALASIKFALGFSNTASFTTASNESKAGSSGTSLSLFGINFGSLGFKTGGSSGSTSQTGLQVTGSSQLVDNTAYSNLTADEFDKVLAFERSLAAQYANHSQNNYNVDNAPLVQEKAVAGAVPIPAQPQTTVWTSKGQRRLNAGN